MTTSEIIYLAFFAFLFLIIAFVKDQRKKALDKIESLSKELDINKHKAERFCLEKKEIYQRLKFQKEINTEAEKNNAKLRKEIDNCLKDIKAIENKNASYEALSSFSKAMQSTLTGTEPTSLTQLSDKTILEESIIKPILHALHAKDTNANTKLRNITLIIDTAIDTIKED
jgi:chromosome segregation ATPase